MRSIVLGLPLLFGMALTGCGEKGAKEGDPSVERNFQGDWRTEYVLVNGDMRMRIKEQISFDTLNHTYKVVQEQRLIYPVDIKYADVSYEGTWSADKEYFYGVIDQSTLKNEIDPKFDEYESYKEYKDLVQDAAEGDMSSDYLMIRMVTPDRIHLFEKDREVAHDLIRPRTDEEKAHQEEVNASMTGKAIADTTKQK